jgi:hypothetical protein
VVCRDESVLVWTELFKLRLEQLGFICRDGLFVEDQDLGNIIVVNLDY